MIYYKYTLKVKQSVTLIFISYTLSIVLNKRLNKHCRNEKKNYNKTEKNTHEQKHSSNSRRWNTPPINERG